MVRQPTIARQMVDGLRLIERKSAGEGLLTVIGDTMGTECGLKPT